MVRNRVIKGSSSASVTAKIVELVRTEPGWALVGEITRGIDKKTVDSDGFDVITQEWLGIIQITLANNKIVLFTLEEVTAALDHGFQLGVESINAPVPPAVPSTPKPNYLEALLASHLPPA